MVKEVLCLATSAYMNRSPPDDCYPEVLEAAIDAFCASGWSSGAATLEPIAGISWTERVPRAPLVMARVPDAASPNRDRGDSLQRALG
jgi:hypothetical protein